MIKTSEMVGGVYMATGATWRMTNDTVVKGADGATTLCLSPIVEVENDDIPLTTLESQVKKILNGKVLASELTSDELDAIISLYDNWAPGIAVSNNQIYAYGDKLYKVIQAHNTQSDWPPDTSPALFAVIAPPGVIPQWVQPTGAHDSYALNATVTHNGQVWRSTVANNVWAPGVYGWTVT